MASAGLDDWCLEMRESIDSHLSILPLVDVFREDVWLCSFV